ncbi:hypothetical protein [Sinomonas halotolerans]|uniref:Integral membrane protein n=1 Tax=Sinomonas halotolerans TaxID=1644133 RepID=A0ABU9WYP5_9MICC
MIATIAVLAPWLLAASRLRAALRRRHDAVFMVALPSALAATANHPTVAAAIERGTGMPGLATLLSGAVIMVGFGLFRSAIVRAVVAEEEQDQILHRGLLQTTASVTVFCVSFVCAALAGSLTPAPGASKLPLDAGAVSDVGVFVFMATMCVFLMAVAAEVCAVCVRYLPDMASGLFRVGFTAVAAGCGLAVVALTAKLLRQVAVLTFIGLEHGPALEAAFDALKAAVAVLLSVGLMLPSLSGRVAQWQVYERYRLVRLHRLWCRTADTRVVIDRVAPLRGAMSPNPRARLHRALVEILDSNLVAESQLLRPRDAELIRKTEGALYA